MHSALVSSTLGLAARLRCRCKGGSWRWDIAWYKTNVKNAFKFAAGNVDPCNIINEAPLIKHAPSCTMKAVAISWSCKCG